MEIRIRDHNIYNSKYLSISLLVKMTNEIINIICDANTALNVLLYPEWILPHIDTFDIWFFTCTNEAQF